MTSLLGWLDEPSGEAGISFHARGRWEHSSYQQIAWAALRVAACLTNAGVGPGDMVTLVLPTGPAYVGVFFGALAAGATPNPVIPPALFTESAGYVGYLAGLLRTVQPRAVVTDAASVGLVSQARHLAGCDFPLLTSEDAEAAAPLGARRCPPGTALLQFSSGSSGAPKAVQVSMRNLEANVAAIAQWLAMRPGDLTATWLPAHHDMGLIGCLLTPAATGTGVLAMTPLSFIRAPLLWLECFGKLGATLTATPAFGLAYLLRHIERQAVRDRDWDLSQWRAVIVGAERVSAELLQRFARALHPWGFRPGALCPAYGLAESTLAVTAVRLADKVRWLDLPPGQAAAATEPAFLDSTAEVAASAVTGSGRPLPGAEVRVVDDSGNAVRDGEVGEILVRGPSVAAAYRMPGNHDHPVADGAGWLHTGDAGITHGDELFVIGRMGDSLKVRGKTIFAEDIEGRIAACAREARHRVAVLLGAASGHDAALILVERAEVVAWDAIVAIVRQYVGPDVPIRLFHGPAGCIARTSSGKPRRRLMWQRLSDQPPDDLVEYPCPSAPVQAGRRNLP